MQLASQITLINHEMLLQVDVSELLHQRWRDPLLGPTFDLMVGMAPSAEASPARQTRVQSGRSSLGAIMRRMVREVKHACI